MKSFLKIVLFCVLVFGGFVGFANFGIPQVKPAPPPTEEKLDLGNMTMDQFIALGDKIFNGKGTCTLCHNNVGKRAPMLDGAGEEAVANNAPLRLKDPRYKGKATTPEEVIAKFGCGACHKIGKEEGALGPDLTHIGKSKNEAYLRKGILDPEAEIAKNCPGAPCSPGMMPADFGAKMTGSELEMLVQYLVKSK